MHFTIAQGDDLLSSHSALALVGEMLDGVSIGKRLDKVELKEHPCPEMLESRHVVYEGDLEKNDHCHWPG